MYDDFELDDKMLDNILPDRDRTKIYSIHFDVNNGGSAICSEDTNKYSTIFYSPVTTTQMNDVRVKEDIINIISKRRKKNKFIRCIGIFVLLIFSLLFVLTIAMLLYLTGGN